MPYRHPFYIFRILVYGMPKDDVGPGGLCKVKSIFLRLNFGHMNYTYFLINIVLLLLSLFLFSNRRARPLGEWKLAMPAALIPAILFIAASHLLRLSGFLTFDSGYVTGFYLGILPLEEWLFCILMPFTGLGIYSFLNLTFPGNVLQKFSLTVSNLLLGLCMAMLFFAYTSGNIYSIIFNIVLGLLLIYIEYFNKLRFMYRFYRAYVVHMILFFPAYFVITSLAQIHFYFMIILLTSVYLFELFKSKINLRKIA
jgi:lycopene cyclase domain-containing protein